MKYDLYIAGQRTWLSKSDQKSRGTSPKFYLREGEILVPSNKLKEQCVWGGVGEARNKSALWSYPTSHTCQT